MRCRFWRATFLPFLISGLQPLLQSSEPNHGALAVRVVDVAGNALPFRVVRCSEVLLPNINLAKVNSGGVLKGLELGKSYQLTITVQGSRDELTTIVTVNNRRSVAVVAVGSPPNALYVTPPSWRFRIAASPGILGPNMWVVARPAFQTEPSVLFRTESSEVDARGRFELLGFHLGPYLLTFYRDNMLLGVAYVKTVDSSSDEIQVSLDWCAMCPAKSSDPERRRPGLSK